MRPIAVFLTVSPIAAAIAALTIALAAEPGAPVRWTPEAVSTTGYEASPGFTPDGREMFYIGADAAFSTYRILQSRCVDGRWSQGIPAPFASAAPVIEADPFVTQDGRRLYYISSRQAPQKQDFDIWFVERRADGAWGAPRRLPEPVNSPHSELLPRLDSQGRLVFGSDRPGGLGKGDIYIATQDKTGRWTVANAGAPVNTRDHEYEAEIARDGRSMIVVADREGRSHLYRYVHEGDGWRETGRIPARDDVFQVGPLLSPRGDRLLFAQADGERSGEIFVMDLVARPDTSWPPQCEATPPRP